LVVPLRDINGYPTTEELRIVNPSIYKDYVLIKESDIVSTRI